MSIPKSPFSNRIFLLVCLNFFFITSFSQVGIGTVTPDLSSMLDVSSTSQGILTPRMSTAQRLSISNPANGLLVYDIDERGFYFFDGNIGRWVKLNSSLEKRDNFVLVKTEADFPAPIGGVITLQTNTYYEINGTIILNNTINLNNAYVSGVDANEDRLIRTSGTIFSGSTGGSIRHVTLLGGFAAGSGGGTAFNITSTVDQRLLIQNTIIANMASVGTISGLGLFFSNIVQYSGNTTGITYNNIGNLLLSNQGWFGNNLGTFETLTGTFASVQKVSGFSEVNGSAVGFNVSSNPTVGKGIILSTVFSGNSTTYVNKYTSGSYPGYNFTNSWGVECPGLPLEIDAVAFGNIFITTQAETNITIQGTPVKINGITSSVRMFRAASPVSNRIVYEGSQTNVFNIQASLSGFSASTNSNYTFFIARNGTILPSTAIQTRFQGGGGGTDVRALSFTGTVELAPGQFIEVFVQNDTGTDNITISRLNLLIN